ncbi:hypothetical protein HYU06_07205 [Candidatus Woesearchaeota archaeon]|nr:hypothetical protein [Candidatus Woesearchaeota archaeon]
MEDISNKTLAVLVSFAIIVSIAGLISTLSIKNQEITGATISNVTNIPGTTSFVVSDNIILTLTDDTINLGNLGTTESASSDTVSDFFRLTNDGTINFNVFAYGVSSPFSSTTNGANLLPNNNYKVYAKNATGGTANTTVRNVPNAIANKTLLVSALSFVNGNDIAYLGINVTVPPDETAGSKSAVLTVYVEAS